jgi:hypothetical protein
MGLRRQVGASPHPVFGPAGGAGSVRHRESRVEARQIGWMHLPPGLGKR